MKKRWRAFALGGLAIAAACGLGTNVLAQELKDLRWDHELMHYTPAEAPAYETWVIQFSSAKSEHPQDLSTIVAAISREATTAIAHIYLGDLIRKPALQKAVMDYVSAQPEFQKHPPPAGFGRWDFKNSTKLRALVEQGLLHSPLVAACNAVLGPHGKAVNAVSMEKLFFAKKDGEWSWDAIVWLTIDPPPKGRAPVHPPASGKAK